LDIRFWAMLDLAGLTLASTAVGVGITFWRLSRQWQSYRVVGRWGWLRGGGSSALSYAAFLLYGGLLAAGVWANGGGVFASVLTFSIVAFPPFVIYVLASLSRRFHRVVCDWVIDPVWWSVRYHLRDTAARYESATRNAAHAAQRSTDRRTESP
jgi:hypothetical protein